MPVLLEPLSGPGVIRTEALYLLPKSGGMVHVPEMRELMEDDVIPDKIRGLDQTPVQ